MKSSSYSADIVGALGIATAVAAVLLLATPTTAHAQASFDYCQYGDQSTLFLVDRTTAYDENDHRVIVESVGAVVNHLGPGDRIVVATIGAHYSQSERAFNACVPGCPHDGFIPELLSQCRPVIAQHDLEVFHMRLAVALRRLTRNTDSTSNSDITGTIAQLTQYPIGGRRYSELFIFSDMLENSQALPWRDFRVMETADAMRIVRDNGLVPEVRGVPIHIAGYGRLHDPGRPYLPADLDRRVRSFWNAYFAAGGGRRPDIEAAFAAN